MPSCPTLVPQILYQPWPVRNRSGMENHSTSISTSSQKHFCKKPSYTRHISSASAKDKTGDISIILPMKFPHLWRAAAREKKLPRPGLALICCVPQNEKWCLYSLPETQKTEEVRCVLAQLNVSKTQQVFSTCYLCLSTMGNGYTKHWTKVLLIYNSPTFSSVQQSPLQYRALQFMYPSLS